MGKRNYSPSLAAGTVAAGGTSTVIVVYALLTQQSIGTLFIASRDIRLAEINRGVLPFVLAVIVKIALLILFPAIILWLAGTR